LTLLNPLSVTGVQTTPYSARRKIKSVWRTGYLPEQISAPRVGLTDIWASEGFGLSQFRIVRHLRTLFGGHAESHQSRAQFRSLEAWPGLLDFFRQVSEDS